MQTIAFVVAVVFGAVLVVIIAAIIVFVVVAVIVCKTIKDKKPTEEHLGTTTNQLSYKTNCSIKLISTTVGLETGLISRIKL